MTEEQWIALAKEEVVEHYADEGIDRAVVYNFEIADEQDPDLCKTWNHQRMKAAILRAARKAGRLRPEDL